ncbi:MAG TPA: prepilin-type N-terminal cleavage/methylation domain-containing protein [Thermoanaerobaculia bacterium]|nr:prepilin-type N-terminal cleavage/methylation domain-containing protein [Thermoanaerobaculia bacterium]
MRCTRTPNEGLPRRGRRLPPPGFSLVELLIVVALIALAALVAVPWFFKIQQRTQLRSDAYEIQAAVIAARMSAVKYNTTASVTITVAAAGLDAHEIETAYGAMTGFGTPTPIPTAKPFLISVKHLNFVETPASGQITFRGDGTLSSPPFPTPGVIKVAGPPPGNLNQITIQADPNGRVRVITPAVWN